MTRYLTHNDLENIKQLSNMSLDDVDFDNSMIDISDNGIVNAFVLSRKSVLIDKMPKKHFPKNRSNQDIRQIYSTINNHEIFALYRKDRNGRALSNLVATLVKSTNGYEIWWIDKESECISVDNFNKLSGFINIKPTLFYWRNI